MGDRMMVCSFGGCGSDSGRVDISDIERQYLNDIKAIIEMHSIVGNWVIKGGKNGGRHIGDAVILCHIDMIRRLELRRVKGFTLIMIEVKVDTSIIVQTEGGTRWDSGIKAIIRGGDQLLGMRDVEEKTITLSVLTYPDAFDGLTVRCGLMDGTVTIMLNI
eukprot:11756656-Ditylum_brightwellii.AAC.1